MQSLQFSNVNGLLGNSADFIRNFHKSAARVAADVSSPAPQLEKGDTGLRTLFSRMRNEIDGKRNDSFLLQNNRSFAQVQESLLGKAMEIYEEMAVLATQASNPLLSDSQMKSLAKSFEDLRSQVFDLKDETFNGQQVFGEPKTYELVSDRLTWDNAKAAADAANAADLDNDVYLATVTSAAEQSEVMKAINSAANPSSAWLGGNDAGVEGEWRWTEGPEQYASGGKGTLFWTGKQAGHARESGTLASGLYQNWRTAVTTNDRNVVENYEIQTANVQANSSFDSAKISTPGETDEGKILFDGYIANDAKASGAVLSVSATSGHDGGKLQTITNESGHDRGKLVSVNNETGLTGQTTGSYFGVQSSSVSGSGVAANFNVTVDAAGNATVNVNNQGDGYVKNETIKISNDKIGGSGVDITFQADDVFIQNPNRNYSGVSTTADSGDGSGATFNVTTDADGVAALSVVNPGSGYVAGDTLRINDSELGGSGQDITFEVATASIRQNPSQTYTDVASSKNGVASDVTFDVTINAAGGVDSIDPVNPGKDHSVGDTFTLANADLGNSGLDLTVDAASVTAQATEITLQDYDDNSVTFTAGADFTVNGENKASVAGALNTLINAEAGFSSSLAGGNINVSLATPGLSKYTGRTISVNNPDGDNLSAEGFSGASDSILAPTPGADNVGDGNASKPFVDGDDKDYLRIGTGEVWIDRDISSKQSAYILEKDPVDSPQELFSQSLTLNGINLPIYYRDDLNLDNIDNAKQAAVDLQRDLKNLLAPEMAQVGQNLAKISKVSEQLEREATQSEFALNRAVGNAGVVENMTQMSMYKIKSDFSLSMVTQANQMFRDLVNFLLFDQR